MTKAKEKDRSKIYILTSVLCAIFLAALDQTIVATAVPKIVKELQDFEAIAWIFPAYMLASTVMVPIYGKLSDIYGRKLFYLGGIIIFLLGSALCGSAIFMPWLIVARAIQGLGAGAIMVESFTIIGDIFPPAERGKWQGLISSVFGLASIVGPLLGGFLTDYASWRWVFFINLPIGIFAIIMTYFNFPQVCQKKIKEKINYAGAALLALGLLAFLFAFMEAERHHQWLTPIVLICFALSAVLLGAFILVDRRSKNPIFPSKLFNNKVFTLSIIAICLTAISMFGAIYYIPLLMQMSFKQSASYSGLSLLPFVLSLSFASALGGQIVSRTGKYKILIIISAIIMTCGMFFLTYSAAEKSMTYLIIAMVLLGAGIGGNFPVYIVIVQSSFGHEELGLVTSSTQLFRNIGATMGTAFLGTLIINWVDKGYSFSHAIGYAFIFCLILCIITVFIVSFLPIIRLRKSNKSTIEEHLA